MPPAHAPLAALRRALRQLCPARARLLVAVSGGGDSQALLHLLAQLRGGPLVATLWAMGVDHGLRAAAAAELDLAAALAQQLQVPFLRTAVQLPPSGNVLAAARRARSAALVATAQRLGADAIALGHHADDQLETLLWQLCRGNAARPPCGMSAQRGPFVRPLLAVPKVALLAYLRAQGVPWAEDPSNRSPARLRAQLRAHVLPTLRRLRPRIAEHASALATSAQADARALGAAARRAYRRSGATPLGLPQAAVARLPQAVGQRLLAHWLAQPAPRRGAAEAHASPPGPPACAHVPAAAVAGLWRARGSVRHLWRSRGVHVAVEAGRYWRLPTPTPAPGAAAPEVRLALDAPTPVLGWPGAHLLLTAAAGPGGPEPPAPASGVALDAAALAGPLTWRPWQPGDRVRPFGMSGQLKVGDLFTNLKVPRALRQSWPVVLCGPEVLWVVGLRRSAHAPLVPGTRARLIVTLVGPLPWRPR